MLCPATCGTVGGMQTFLPFADFAESAKVLDRQRLGKQRVEALQILDALTGKRDGWVNHPAVKMWRGYQWALVLYTDDMCTEWVARGYDNTTCGIKLATYKLEIDPFGIMPPWLGDEAFHESHQSNLVRKDPDHYADIFPHVPDDLEYVWP